MPQTSQQRKPSIHAGFSLLFDSGRTTSKHRKTPHLPAF